MVTRTWAEVRQDFATRIAAIDAAWWEAPVPFDLFGPSLVPDAVPSGRGHLSFAVGVPSSESAGDRQKAADGLWLRSLVAVRFLARIPPKGQVAGVDAGLVAELALVAQIMAQSASWPVNFQILYDSSTRSTPAPGEWAMHEVRFKAYHRVTI